MEEFGRRAIWGWFLTGWLCCLSVAAGRFGDDCRERLPNGHRMPYQQKVAGFSTGRNRAWTESPFCHGGAVTVEDNPFGKDFAEAGFQWTEELCGMDSDGDGQTNGEELGDPCCVWWEGAEMPQWMKDWHVSHPGFVNSTQVDIERIASQEKTCSRMSRLGSESFYNAGEGGRALDFTLTPFTFSTTAGKKKGNAVVFHSDVYNLPDDYPYDVVGLERWFEDKEFLEHLVKHEVSFCAERFEVEGEHTVTDPFDDRCLDKVYMWRIGSTSKFVLPKNTGLRAGKGTRRISFTSRYVYVIPPSPTNLTTIKSGLRFHITTSPRTHQLGVLRADFRMKTEVAPSNGLFAWTNLFQIEVDHSIAPDGVKVVGYLPAGSQHFRLTKTWVEKLRRTSGRRDQLYRLTELEQAEELGRDVEWFDLGSEVWLQHADYLSNTCVYNATDPAWSINLEICYTSLYYYPIEAMNYVLGYSGPVYRNDLTEHKATYMSSIVDYFTLPSFDTRLPLWRQLYLRGEYRCNPRLSLGLTNTTETTHGVSSKMFKLRAPCRKGRSMGDFEVTEGRLAFQCSEECALIQFNVMGCMFLKDAVKHNGEILFLFPAPKEAIGTVLCGAEFQKIYEDHLAGLNDDLALTYHIFGPAQTAAANSRQFPSKLLFLALTATLSLLLPNHAAGT